LSAKVALMVPPRSQMCGRGSSVHGVDPTDAVSVVMVVSIRECRAGRDADDSRRSPTCMSPRAQRSSCENPRSAP